MRRQLIISLSLINFCLDCRSFTLIISIWDSGQTWPDIIILCYKRVNGHLFVHCTCGWSLNSRYQYRYISSKSHQTIRLIRVCGGKNVTPLNQPTFSSNASVDSRHGECKFWIFYRLHGVTQIIQDPFWLCLARRYPSTSQRIATQLLENFGKTS